MTDRISRRGFALWAGMAGVAMGNIGHSQEEGNAPPSGPVEAPFERDYEPPKFKPSWKKQQINRSMAQDFVIYAHSDLDKVKMLLEREPGLLNATIDWGQVTGKRGWEAPRTWGGEISSNSFSSAALDQIFFAPPCLAKPMW